MNNLLISIWRSSRYVNGEYPMDIIHWALNKILKILSYRSNPESVKYKLSSYTLFLYTQWVLLSGYYTVFVYTTGILYSVYYTVFYRKFYGVLQIYYLILIDRLICYQIVHFGCFGFIRVPAAHLKELENSWLLDNTPITLEGREKEINV